MVSLILYIFVSTFHFNIHLYIHHYIPLFTSINYLMHVHVQNIFLWHTCHNIFFITYFMTYLSISYLHTYLLTYLHVICKMNQQSKLVKYVNNAIKKILHVNHIVSTNHNQTLLTINLYYSKISLI